MTDQSIDEKKKKRGGLVRILGIVFGGLALVGAGGGAGYVKLGGQGPADIEEIVERKIAENEEAKKAEEGAAETAEGAVDENGQPIRPTKPAPTQEVFVTSYYEFPGTFTTNLRNSKKFLQVGLGVATQYDQTVISNVDAHQLSLRSEVLGVISDFTEEEVQGKAGREALAARMRDAINLKLEALEGFGGVETVYFTSFILQ